MKILVLTKRQYMGKDLIDDRFGRFRELPLELARLGHEVRGLALSYRPKADNLFVDTDGSGDAHVTWHSINLLNGFPAGPLDYWRRAISLTREFRPDIIWACSDAYHAIFGRRLAKHVGSLCVVDLYDNFEAFRASQFPGVRPLFRRAVRAADGVTSFSQRLADHVARTHMRTKSTLVIENGVRKELFYPQDPNLCRQQLGLPANAKIVGTAGALDHSRGIETLFKAFEQLSAEVDDLHLVLAGPRQRGMSIPAGPRVHDLHELPHAEVPLLCNSLDVAVVCYHHSAQGEYSFPQKAYEILACRVPLVAAAVGSMNELLLNYSDCLYEPEDSASLASAIRRQLQAKTVIEMPTPTWADSAKQLSDFFLQIMDGMATSAMQTPKNQAPR
ncbi:MAG: glycosyltransferase [Candidatus Binatia bacterium]